MGKTAWQINAGWEVKMGKVICRWFVCWAPYGKVGEFVGAIAGYSGGGAFEVERFYGRLKEDKLSQLWIDYTDRLTGEEIDFDSLGKIEIGLCEQALDQVWLWNDEDAWLESDEVLLRKDMMGKAAASGDMLIIGTTTPPFLGHICELAGLTAKPVART